MGGDWKEMFLGVETNDFTLVRYYLDRDIDVNYQHPEFLTSALIESIARNHIEMMGFLLERGADPTIKEALSNKPPMQIAKELRRKEAVELLNKYMNTNETLEAEHISFLSKIVSFFKF
jgi:ankyrin repeat protein